MRFVDVLGRSGGKKSSFNQSRSLGTLIVVSKKYHSLKLSSSANLTKKNGKCRVPHAFAAHVEQCVKPILYHKFKS